MLEAGHAAFRIQQMRGHFAPGHEPQRSVGGAGTTCIDNVRSGFGCLVVVAWGQAKKRLWLGTGVAVEHVARGFVVEAL
ncbi:hypothetical protein D3C76_1193960 [compost metagenome]